MVARDERAAASGDVVPVACPPAGRTTGELGELFDGEPELNGECDAVLLALRSANEPLGAPLVVDVDAVLEVVGSRALNDLVCVRIGAPDANSAAACDLLERTGEKDVGDCTPLALVAVELRVKKAG